MLKMAGSIKIETSHQARHELRWLWAVRVAAFTSLFALTALFYRQFSSIPWTLLVAVPYVVILMLLTENPLIKNRLALAIGTGVAAALFLTSLAALTGISTTLAAIAAIPQVAMIACAARAYYLLGREAPKTPEGLLVAFAFGLVAGVLFFAALVWAFFAHWNSRICLPHRITA